MVNPSYPTSIITRIETPHGKQSRNRDGASYPTSIITRIETIYRQFL